MEHLSRLVEHLAWADHRVLEALRTTEPAEPRSLELFGHVLAAEHVWLSRLIGRDPALPVWPALTLADCARIAADNAAQLRQFVATLGPRDLERPVTYTNSAEQQFSTGIHDILLHVALHGAYHRGQIATALRGSDRVPASTDYIAYIRGVPAATRTQRPKLRTPDDRFRDLPDFPFEPHYQDVDGLRIHYLDEGPRTGEVVLLLHGEPTWCFLYRKMIPVLTGAGLRVIAPDFIGFGRSDKLTRREDYSYALHVDLMRRFLNLLGLRGITLFGQDWGGLIGLRLVAEGAERFERVVVANTGLPDGMLPINPAFFQWQEYSQKAPRFESGRIVGRGTAAGIAPEVARAYDAPFPDPTYQEGARVFPILVPIEADDPAAVANGQAWKALRRWTKPFLTAFSDGDPIMAGGDKVFQNLVPGAAGQPHLVIHGAGHFLQEDKGVELAQAIVEFVHRNPVR